MAGSKPKLYLETSVPSYYVARPSVDIVLAGHQHVTRLWWEQNQNSYQIYISELVIQESQRGDPEAAQ